jgi:hypothetical protein
MAEVAAMEKTTAKVAATKANNMVLAKEVKPEISIEIFKMSAFHQPNVLAATCF